MFTWILNNVEAFKKSDVKGYIQPIMDNLTDKNKEIRTASE